MEQLLDQKPAVLTGPALASALGGLKTAPAAYEELECGDVSPDVDGRTFYCTRRSDHRGKHIAHDGNDHPLAMW